MVRNPPHRERDEILGLVEAVRPGLPEGRDAGHDQARSAAREIRIGETALRHQAGPFAFDDKIGFRHERTKVVLAVRRIEIERDAALADVLVNELERSIRPGLPVDERRPMARRRAARRLDQDHISTQIGEQLPGVSAAEAGHFDDAEALKRGRWASIAVRDRGHRPIQDEIRNGRRRA